MSSIMDKKLVNFHVTLKRLRQESGHTQKQIAEKMGLTYQSYQAYESGISLPTLNNFLKLCEIFDVTPDELLDF